MIVKTAQPIEAAMDLRGFRICSNWRSRLTHKVTCGTFSFFNTTLIYLYSIRDEFASLTAVNPSAFFRDFNSDDFRNRFHPQQDTLADRR